MKIKVIINLLCNCINISAAGVSLAILAPFYPNEAIKKGISVTQTGMVLGSVFFTNVVGK